MVGGVHINFNTKAEPPPARPGSRDGCQSPLASVVARGALARVLARRPLQTTKGEKARQPAPRYSRQSVCSRVVEAGLNQAHGFLPIAFSRGREVIAVLVLTNGQKIALPRPHYAPDRFAKQSVGAFHQVSLVQSPVAGAREQ